MRQGDMKDHVVVCGYGNGGESAADELVNRGMKPECIVIVDTDEAALHRAAELGHVGLRGDATREAVLLDARVDRALGGIDDEVVDELFDLAMVHADLRCLCWVYK